MKDEYAQTIVQSQAAYQAAQKSLFSDERETPDSRLVKNNAPSKDLSNFIKFV